MPTDALQPRRRGGAPDLRPYHGFVGTEPPERRPGELESVLVRRRRLTRVREPQALQELDHAHGRNPVRAGRTATALALEREARRVLQPQKVGIRAVVRPRLPLPLRVHVRDSPGVRAGMGRLPGPPRARGGPHEPLALAEPRRAALGLGRRSVGGAVAVVPAPAVATNPGEEPLHPVRLRPAGDARSLPGVRACSRHGNGRAGTKEGPVARSRLLCSNGPVLRRTPTPDPSDIATRRNGRGRGR